jgi:hypothetical protein
LVSRMCEMNLWNCQESENTKHHIFCW